MDHFVDPAFVPLLADPRVALRPPRPDSYLADYRARLDAPMKAVRGPAMRATEEVVSGVALRNYVPEGAGDQTIILLHGGGFVVGSLDTHDAMCRALAAESGMRVVSVGYRLAPEAPFPAARDDACAAVHHLAATHSIAAIVGDSAGGYLAVCAAAYASECGIAVDALALLYPVVDPACATPSWDRLGTGYLLERDWMRWAWSAYLGGAALAQPAFNLLNADLARLPPTRIVTASADPLRDEGEALAAAIVAAGGVASFDRYEGMIHGFASLPMLTPRASEGITDLSKHIVNTSVDYRFGPA